MTINDITNARLINQQLAETTFKKPAEIVSWLGAMQAQEFAMAKWAIGLRLQALKEIDIENAFNAGDFLRTHLLRPTWHFVAPPDIRWLLKLTAPRVMVANAFMYRKFDLDSKIFKLSNDTMEKALAGKRQLTRLSLKAELAQKKIVADGLRLSYLMMQAELDGIICSGAREGKQFTYALLEERLPPVKNLHHEEALVMLANRYFTSRGPATIEDFVSWSGLSVKEAKTGVNMLDSTFVKESINEKTHIFLPATSSNKKIYQRTFLMPDYDEYGMSYKDRTALFDPAAYNKKDILQNTISYHNIVINGKIAGTWKQMLSNESVTIETALFAPINKAKEMELTKSIRRFALFSGKKLEAIKRRH